MASIRWVKIKDRLIDMNKVEHVVMTKAVEPPEDGQDRYWRERRQAMITFDIENRHYCISFDSDEQAQKAFDDLWSVL